MSVKTIFKALIGTILVIVISSVIIEFFNVSVTSMQLKQASKMAAKQACVLFTQETYKENNSGGAVNMSDITDESNYCYVTGSFYGTASAKEIWKSIYGNSEFEAFCDMNVTLTGGNTKKMRDLFNDLGTMKKAAQVAQGQSISGTDKAKAIMFANNMYTTSNLGIPYLDKNITNKIFQWNLTKVLMADNKSSIQSDSTSGSGAQHYVNYKGFRCFTSEAQITNYEYKVYDLTKIADQKAFNDITGLKIKQAGVAGDGISIKTDVSGDAKENYYVTVVGIEYEMPVSYTGITPIKKIFSYAWEHEVKGLGETAPDKGASPWSGDTKQNLTSGGLSGDDDGQLSSTGKLIYTLVR